MVYPDTDDARFDKQNVTAGFIFATFKADAAIDDGEPVKASTNDNEVSIATAETDLPIGIADSSVSAANDEISVLLYGPIKKMIASTTITAGDEVTATTAGQIRTKSAADKNRIGVAIQSATAQNDRIPVVMLPGLTL